MRKRKVSFGVKGLPTKAEVFVVFKRHHWQVRFKNQLIRPQGSSLWSGKVRIRYGEPFKFFVYGLNKGGAGDIYDNLKNTYVFGHGRAWFGWGSVVFKKADPRLRYGWWVADYYFPVGNAGRWNEYNVLERK